MRTSHYHDSEQCYDPADDAPYAHSLIILLSHAHSVCRWIEHHTVLLRSRAMSNYSVTNIGPLDSWRDHFGGFVPATTRTGRRVVDHELNGDVIGISATAYEPGEEAGYWHSHSEIDEVYLFLEGEGQMGLDDEVIDVHPGTVVQVGIGVMRTWRCKPDSPTQLRWLCVRAGVIPLPAIPDDAVPITDIPMPW